jgi:exopolysaccharide production protein ExoY
MKNTTLHPLFTKRPPTETSLSKIVVKHLFWKRLFDLFFSICALALGSPVLFLIATFVRLSSPGPALYSCKRVGRGGKTIKCYKFRTMYSNAEEELKKLLQENSSLREEWDKYFKLKNDPRITPLGKFLRKTSLDELPQLWNVLKGDLSVVGPRPLTDYEVQNYLKEKALKILSVRPGLTGIWQTSGRNELSMDERIRLDEQYVDTRSLGKDIWLVLKTIPMLFFPKGAY